MLWYRAAERGQTMPFIALLLVALLGFAGLAADVGYLRYQQRIAQSAADSAAIAGATELGFGTDYVAAAQRDAASNGFTDGANNVTVTAVNPPATGAYAGNADAVEVNVTAQYNTFFMRVFPRFATATIKTRAVAIRSDDLMCLYLLSPSGSSNLNSSNIQLPNCGMAINQSGQVNMQGATINAKFIDYAGSTPNENKAVFTSATPQPALPVSDPCMEIEGCRNLTNNPPSSNPCTSTYNGSGTLSPGCYNGLDINPKGKNASSTVFLNPGVYVITGNLNGGNNVTLTGNNVTIYVTGNGKLTLNGATLNLTAPTSGPYAGVLMYQNPSDNNIVDLEGASCNIGSCTSSVTGVLYFPTQKVNYTHHGGGYTISIFGSGNFNMSESDYTAPPLGGSQIKRAVLAE